MSSEIQQPAIVSDISIRLVHSDYGVLWSFVRAHFRRIFIGKEYGHKSYDRSWLLRGLKVQLRLIWWSTLPKRISLSSNFCDHCYNKRKMNRVKHRFYVPHIYDVSSLS
ncbi:hypothetical protein AVEN_143415-1 [Araneus ventricosus]|uniref:Uncharacterized protein n=1 Tax=Araneus ventricosus TaxID=182803 RepID=A0A4Y2AEH9_ARAVE|nr:hypothetical protein AVEN_143415-1 [Araneus ventricosus]